MTLRQASVLTGMAAERPAAGDFIGRVFIASDTGAKSVWTGSTWLGV